MARAARTKEAIRLNFKPMIPLARFLVSGIIFCKNKSPLCNRVDRVILKSVLLRILYESYERAMKYLMVIVLTMFCSGVFLRSFWIISLFFCFTSSLILSSSAFFPFSGRLRFLS